MNPIHMLQGVIKSLEREKDWLEKALASNKVVTKELKDLLERITPYFATDPDDANKEVTKPRYVRTNHTCSTCRRDKLLKRIDKPADQLVMVHECMTCLKEELQQKLGRDVWVDPDNPTIVEDPDND